MADNSAFTISHTGIHGEKGGGYGEKGGGYGEKEEKKKTAVPQALLLLVIVLSVAVTVMTIILSVLLVKTFNNIEDTDILKSPKLGANQDVYSFDDMFDSRYRPRGFSASWIKGSNSQIYRNDAGDVIRHNRDTESVDVLIPNTVMTEVGAFSYYLSPDTTMALLAYDYRKLWRYSFHAKYKIYNIATGEISPFPNDDSVGDVRLQYAAWASQGQALVYVFGNNLHYQSSPSDQGEAITTSGDPLYVFNGVTDWLYEEDVLGSRSAVYWSPDAGLMVYGQFDDSDVPLVQYSLYGSDRNAYSSLYQAAYPKPGDVRNGGVDAGPNSDATLWLVDTTNINSPAIQLIPPQQLQNVDHYYTRVHWISSTQVMVTWTNRVQNEAYVYLYDITGEGTLNYELQVTGGWIDSPWPVPVMLDSDREYLTIISRDQGPEHGTWKHMAKVTQTDTSQPGVVEFLTQGLFEVLSILHYDATMRVLYYYTTGGDPKNRDLYRIGLDGASEEDLPAVCVSCDMELCDYVTASFSSTSDMYTLGCLGPDVPSYRLRRTDPSIPDKILEDNADIRANLANKALPTREFLQIQVGGGHFAEAEIYYPPGYQPGDSHPLLIDAYAGPGSQAVSKRFPMGGTTSNWIHHLGSQYGIITATVDGRGSSGRGDNYRYEMYRKMGTVEVEDQIIAARYFREQDYISADARSAIWGWSYGGMTSSLAMGRQVNDLECAIAVAPVTSMRLYDTAYTERYMGLATNGDNAAGYNETDVMLLVENFRNKKFLLAHGTHDDNVHYRNTALLNDKLVQAQIQFRLLNYPDQDHGIGQDSRHLFRALTDFLSEDCYTSTPTRH
jgi:dipeptidyl aminopeptidase/acylaminoacyl peptidase